MNKEAAIPLVGKVERTYPPASQGWAIVAILFLLYIVSLLDRNIFNLLGEHVRRDLGLTDFQLSLLYGPAFAVTYAIGGLPLGWALDRFSRRKVIWGAVSLWSFGTIMCGLARGFPQIFAARSFVGAGEAVMVPANQTVLSAMFPPERLAFPMAIYNIGAQMGMGLSLGLGGLLTDAVDPAGAYALPIVGDMSGWQLIFLMVGAPGFLFALLIFLVREPPRHTALNGEVLRTGYKDYWAFIKQNKRFFIGLHLAGIFATMVVNAVWAWTPAHFLRVHKWPIDQVGLWLGAATIIGPCIFLPLHGLIVNRLLQRGRSDGQILYMMITLLLAVVPFLIAYNLDDGKLSLVFLAIGLGLMMSYGVMMPAALMLVVPGELRGKAAAILQLITAFAGIGLGPTMVAVISKMLGGEQHIGPAMAICALFALPLGAFFASFTLKRLREQSI